MDIQKMNHFLVFAESLNLSKAAEKLFISRQALTKQLHSLEDELGARLFEHASVRIVLTEVGKKVVELYTPTARMLTQCESDIRAFVAHKKAFIRIGYFNGLPYSRAVAPVIQFLSEQIPDVETSITALDSVDAHRMLAEDQIDLLISVHHSGYAWQGIRCISLAELPHKIIVSANHPWYHKEAVTIEDMAMTEMVCYEESFGPDRQSFMKHVRVRERIYVRNVGTYSGILAQGKAFGIVSELHNQSEGDHRLLDMPPEYAGTTQIIAACKPLHPRVDVFEKLGK